MTADKGEVCISQNIGPPFAKPFVQRLEFDFFCIEELQKIFCSRTEYKSKMYVIQKK